MISDTLTVFAATPLPSREQAAYHAAYIAWALPRFLSSPPSEEETAALRREIQSRQIGKFARGTVKPSPTVWLVDPLAGLSEPPLLDAR